MAADDDSIERPDLTFYAAEKLGSVVYILATNPHDVGGRLCASHELLAMVATVRAGLPNGLRQQFEKLWADLKHNPAGEPEFGASFRRKRLKTLAKFAERILSIEARLDAVCRRQPAL